MSTAASKIDDPAWLVERTLYRLSLVKSYDDPKASVKDRVKARRLMLGFTNTDLRRALDLLRETR